MSVCSVSAFDGFLGQAVPLGLINAAGVDLV